MNLQDVRFALRMLRRNPGFAVVAVLIFAFGCGANTAVFSIINAVVLRPLPYSNPDRLYRIESVTPDGARLISSPDLATWREQTRVFERMASVKYGQRILGGVDEPEQLFGHSVSPEFLPLFGTTPALGRWFSDDEFKPGSVPVVLVSSQLWQRRFHGDPNLIGKSILLDGVNHVVVGIMPRAFPSMWRQCDFWVPLFVSPEEMTGRDLPAFVIFAKAKAGISPRQVEAEADSISHTLVSLYPEEHKDWRATVTRWQDSLAREDRPTLWMLLGAVAFVLTWT